MMHSPLHHGIPTEDDYESLLETDEFKELESFSNHFLVANQTNLGSYAQKWVNDPLHQWSRQWEYPYVFHQLQTILKVKNAARILDAGSGVTFFPYYIKSKYSLADIHCVDYDKNLATIYQRINATSKEKVSFASGDLKNLTYEDNSFDIIYCVSVLEHTDDYARIIERFHKILRAGGSLVITFDISLDGTRDISIEKGNQLLGLLTDKFAVPENVSLYLQPNMTNVFTTITANKINSSLLPWKLPAVVYQTKSLITRRKWISWPPLLTVLCSTFVKRLS
jgi:SAM-dependent methyltransferase